MTAQDPAIEHEDAEGLVWTASITLLGNSVLWRALFLLLGLSSLLLGVIFLFIAPVALLIIPFFIAGFTLFYLLFCLLLGNRLLMRYALVAEGYGTELADPRLVWLMGGALAAGTVSGTAGLAGAGMIGLGSRRQFHPWATVTDLKVDAPRLRVRAGLGWRGHDFLQATEDSFPKVAARAVRLWGATRADQAAPVP